MTFSDMPTADVVTTVDVAVRLLESQWPDWSGQEITPLANGWDNVLYRVGSDHVVRLPRREMAVQLVLNEARLLPELAPVLPVPIPAPIFRGGPQGSYPWPWTVVPWLDGSSAATTARYDRHQVALALADFLRSLHLPGDADAPNNPFRGGPLIEKDDVVRERALGVSEHRSTSQIVTLWERLSAAPSHSRPPLWLHGDLHPHNILVDGGGLAAVVDFGDLTAGDPATDLAVAWMLSPDSIPDFRGVYENADAALWARARGWALHLGLAYLFNSANNPTMSQVGFQTIDAVLSDRPD